MSMIYMVNAFTQKPFGGNPAAVCPLTSWLDVKTMQAIAAQNNLSETAFFVLRDKNHYDLRWFTPTHEVNLCGHATLASAFIIFNYLNSDLSEIHFHTHSGELVAKRNEGFITLDFPIDKATLFSTTPNQVLGLGLKPIEVWKGTDLMVVLSTQEEVANFNPKYELISEIDARGLVITAPGKEADFVSRWFGPQVGVPEDPVTGSAHCLLTPYWAKKLNKSTLFAQQLSKRGGEIKCELMGDRVSLTGAANLFLSGQISY